VAAAQPPDGARVPERPGWRPPPLILGLLALSVAGMLVATVAVARLAGPSTTGPADATRLVPVPTVHVYPPGRQRAPDFRLTGLDGGTVDLTAYRGRPVVVNFWASWCHPCRKEFPLLANARTKYKDDGLQIIGVSFRDIPSDARTFVKDQGAKWTFGRDDRGAVAKDYGVRAVPQTFFIDADGTIRDRVFGITSAKDLDHTLEKILPPRSR
jgi:cytochrome c biogenesis protein CcmG, thiol:disulfide interchange protein DsbE